MNKSEIKEILMSMRNGENEDIVTNLLGKIDLISDEELQPMIDKVGKDKETVEAYLKRKIEEQQEKHEQPHIPINKMFAYGVSGNSIHLHMPVDLRPMLSENGISKTIDIVNANLLDAIERIRRMKNDGYYKFEGTDCIYMISPILVGREMKFLKELDFETQTYKKRQLQDDEFVQEHPEAQLATYIFGRDNHIGTAKIGLDTINSDEWQEKRKAKVQEFKEKGIQLKNEGKDISE